MKINCIANSPLNQFELATIQILFSVKLNILIITSLITIGGLLLILNPIYLKKNVFSLILVWINQISDYIYLTNLKTIRKEHKSVFFICFLLLACFNLLGLVPFCYTVTSAFFITFLFAIVYFAYLNIFLLLKRKWTFSSNFLPAKNMYWIAPFLIVIELISYFSRMISLCLRLFANMVAGHALLKILVIFLFWTFNSSTNCAILYITIQVLILAILFFLELFLAVLQAYVFTLLIVLYHNDIPTS